MKLCPINRVVTGVGARLRTSLGERTRDGIFRLDFPNGRDRVHVAGVNIVLGSREKRKERKKKKCKK
jgi:hypothetical protein